MAPLALKQVRQDCEGATALRAREARGTLAVTVLRIRRLTVAVNVLRARGLKVAVHVLRARGVKVANN
eukprot:153093-Alexandrium_andersonii.AAC.1